jgi:hypothetical protein
VTVSQLLTLLLGGGAVATITALFNGIKSLREGSRGKERDTIAGLIKDRKDAQEDRDKAEDARDAMMNERDQWRNWAGRLEYGLAQHGVELPPGRPTFDEAK